MFENISQRNKKIVDEIQHLLTLDIHSISRIGEKNSVFFKHPPDATTSGRGQKIEWGQDSVEFDIQELWGLIERKKLKN